MKTVNMTSWAAWKSLIISKGLLPQYVELPDRYDIFAVESTVCWEYSILKNGDADIVDFETNYKSTYNKPLEVKAGPGRPIRTASSPQPINTLQRFKGYKLTLGANQTSAYVDVSFPSLVYVKGGRFYCSNIVTDDHLHVDVLLSANNMVVIQDLVENCYLIDGASIPFESDESMALAPEFKLRITLEGTSSLTARTVYIVAEYFV